MASSNLLSPLPLELLVLTMKYMSNCEMAKFVSLNIDYYNLAFEYILKYCRYDGIIVNQICSAASKINNFDICLRATVNAKLLPRPPECILKSIVKYDRLDIWEWYRSVYPGYRSQKLIAKLILMNGFVEMIDK